MPAYGGRMEDIMGINTNYAVFGLGRYGSAVAAELIENGADVIAVDINPKIVEEKMKKNYVA